MKLKLLLTIGAVLGLLTRPTALASPFQPQDIARDPAMVLHIDADAVRDCSFTRSVLAKPEVQQELSSVSHLFFFDLATQLHGLTIYTTVEHPTEAILIVYADFDPSRLIELNQDKSFHFNVGVQGTTKTILRSRKFKTVNRDSHVIYSWESESKKSDNGAPKRVYSAVWGNRIVFGQTEDQLIDALDILTEKTNFFTGTVGLPASSTNESLLAQGSIFKFDFGGEGPEADVFKTTKELRCKISEAGTNTTAVVWCRTENAARAAQLSSLAQGLMALLRLRIPEADAAELGDATKFEQNGPVMQVTLTLPSIKLANKSNVTISRDDKGLATNTASAKK